MKDLEKAINILNSGAYTCVLVKGESIYTSKKKGISPVLDLINEGVDLVGFSLADKVIGKSVALLILKAQIKDVYAEIISQHAITLLNQFDISYQSLETVDRIMNNTQTGFCPMESVILNESDSEEAYIKLVNKLEQLRKGV